jgi:hypothetical protein
MRGENFVAHLDGLGGTPVCFGTPVAHHWSIATEYRKLSGRNHRYVIIVDGSEGQHVKWWCRIGKN